MSKEQDILDVKRARTKLCVYNNAGTCNNSNLYDEEQWDGSIVAVNVIWYGLAVDFGKCIRCSEFA